ncbi:MAG: ABC transporter ATP-binding protein [Ruminococcaceae bacterium]|nr:ABC transporter ATP-binding protein [Oscillospiraceae bacterium]
MNVIETKDLTKFYGSSRGIVDVTLSVNEGDFFGFIGPNGAGKSTLIRTLLGLISKSKGEAYVFGKDITKEKTQILREVGYLPSEAAFYSGMKVCDILELSAKMRDKDCREEAKRLCERLELDTAKKIESLSLGNRKKVGIVCALQHKPKLYILDEPTSGLDPLMQKEFYTILKERNDEGATVFLSSHVLSEIGRYCKSAAVIREGRILVSDSVEKLGHTGVKKVTLRGVKCIPDISDAKDMRFENDTVHFLYSGKATELTKKLADLDFEDISICDPELDEVFMHYYSKEEN